MKKTQTGSPDEIRAAAELLRANGYAVVTRSQAEHWDRWLAESHDREREHYDVNVRLYHELGFLEAHVERLLGGSRPAWWREFRRRRRTDSHLHNPVVGRDPAVRVS